MALHRLGVAKPVRVIFPHLHADHVCGLLGLADMPPCLASREALTQLWRLARARAPAGVAPRMAALPMGLVQKLQQMVDRAQLTEIEVTPGCVLPRAFAAFGTGFDLLGNGSVIAVRLPGHGHGQIGLWLARSSRGPVVLAADAAFSRAVLRDGVLPPVAVLARFGDPVACWQTFAALAPLALEEIEISAAHDTHVQTA